MRIAALYDIHGNLPALEAVLQEVHAATVDEVIVGGDVFPGPMSVECLERLLALDVPTRFIRGNGDREVLALARGGPADAVSEPYRQAMLWEARRLDGAQRRTVAGWPESLRVRSEADGDVLFCHATPRNDVDIFTRATAADVLRPVFEKAGASLVVCGHTHMQFDRRVGAVRVVNAGSVGMPFGEPGAYWLLLDGDLELRATDYDLARAARRLRACGHPGASDFVERNVLAPPSEREMLALFERAELS